LIDIVFCGDLIDDNLISVLASYAMYDIGSRIHNLFYLS